MKIWKYEINNNWIGLGAVALIVIIIFIILSIPSCQKPDTTPQQVLNEALAVAQAPLLTQITDLKKQAAENSSKLSASQAKYTTLVNQYVDLEKRKANVKAPTTNTEIRDRFIALGFAPLAGK